jgi:hypothetical protein
MRFGATRSQIYDAQKTARSLWADTQTQWDDEVSQRHYTEVVEPLDQATTDLLRAIDQLASIMVQIRHECENPGPA